MKELKLDELEQTAKACEEAGFVTAALETRKKISRARKLAVAYEHYKYVPQTNIDGYQAELKKKTFHRSGGGAFWVDSYQELALVPMREYAGVPPGSVLADVKVAMDRGCFDTFEVAYVHEKNVRVPDPIVFGRVEGCTDRFYVAQWGDDVKITDLLKENEG